MTTTERRCNVLRLPTDEEVTLLKLLPDELISWRGHPNPAAYAKYMVTKADRTVGPVIAALFVAWLSDSFTLPTIGLCMFVACIDAAIRVCIARTDIGCSIDYAITNMRVIIYDDDIANGTLIRNVKRVTVKPKGRDVGTLLFQTGLTPLDRPEFLCIDHPYEVEAIFREMRDQL